MVRRYYSELVGHESYVAVCATIRATAQRPSERELLRKSMAAVGYGA